MEYPQMRRKDRELDREAALGLLAGGSFGVLSTVSESGQCYGVPVNYVVADEIIYIHCATSGAKLNNISFNPNVSLTVVPYSEVAPGKFTTLYESAVAFGAASVVEDPKDKKAALMSLCKKYGCDTLDKAEAYIAAGFERTTVVRIEIRHVTGKAHKI